MKLWAVCRPMEVCGAAAVMADAEAARCAVVRATSAEAMYERHGAAAWRCCAAA
jgi:hypothetical protein